MTSCATRPALLLTVATGMAVTFFALQSAPAAEPAVATPKPTIQFNRDVRPPLTLATPTHPRSPPPHPRPLPRALRLYHIALPPTASEVEAFVNDKSPDAYEKQVTRLLASPHYGERMAVAWLDLARFADTVGY